MELLGLVPESFKAILGGTLSNDFAHTLLLFTAAAWVHGRQVRGEIRKQMGILVSVLQRDLDAQKAVLEMLSGRVTKIENHLNAKIESLKLK